MIFVLLIPEDTDPIDFYLEVDEWCKNHMQHEYDCWPSSRARRLTGEQTLIDSVEVLVTDETDHMLFKLRWM